MVCPAATGTGSLGWLTIRNGTELAGVASLNCWPATGTSIAGVSHHSSASAALWPVPDDAPENDGGENDDDAMTMTTSSCCFILKKGLQFRIAPPDTIQSRPPIYHQCVAKRRPTIIPEVSQTTSTRCKNHPRSISAKTLSKKTSVFRLLV